MPWDRSRGAFFVLVDIPVDYSTTDLLPSKTTSKPIKLYYFHDYESKGRGFESRRAHQEKTPGS